MSARELRELVSEMRDRIAGFRQEYGVGSPDELAVDRTNEVLSGSERTAGEPDEEAIRNWKTTRRNLAVATAALSIAHAEKFVDTDPRPSSETASSP